MATAFFNGNFFGGEFYSASGPAPPTVLYQSDGKGRAPRKRRKRKHDTEILFADIERSIREMVLGVAPSGEPLVARASQTPLPVDVSQGINHALDQLVVLAEENRDLSVRLARLQAAVKEYERQREQALSDDEEEALMVLL